MTTHLAEIPMPASIRALPIDPVRKIPVPWFVSWIDGKPEFRCMAHERLTLAVKERLCWVCGTKLDNRATHRPADRGYVRESVPGIDRRFSG